MMLLLLLLLCTVVLLVLGTVFTFLRDFDSNNWCLVVSSIASILLVILSMYALYQQWRARKDKKEAGKSFWSAAYLYTWSSWMRSIVTWLAFVAACFTIGLNAASLSVERYKTPNSDWQTAAPVINIVAGSCVLLTMVWLAVTTPSDKAKKSQ